MNITGILSRASAPALILSAIAVFDVHALPVSLGNVPAYNWYHGCGPTAAASVLAYWDLMGYGNLFTASGWEQLRFTANVQDQISSPEHNAKYDPSPDNASLPVPPATSIADYFHTSVNQGYGWSWLSDAPNAFTGYGAYRGYEINAWNETFGSNFIWADLVAEIDAGRPMMFLVDSDGNGGTDHFVPVLGYDDRAASGRYYGSYTTWSEAETLYWMPFRGMGATWGVGYATFVQPEPVPDGGATWWLLAVGIGAAWLRRCGESLR